MRTQGTYYIRGTEGRKDGRTDGRTDGVKIAEKVIKNNLRIISKPHAYFQTMSKTPVKFQKNQYKTVEEMRTQGTHYPFTLIVKMSEKWLSSTGGKSVKK